METEATNITPEPQKTQSGEYEPPRIETVLTADELEREVLYAGGPVPSGVVGPRDG